MVNNFFASRSDSLSSLALMKRAQRVSLLCLSNKEWEESLTDIIGLEFLAEHEVELASALASPYLVETITPVDTEESEH